MPSQPHAPTQDLLPAPGTSTKPLFLYDGACPTCRAGVAWFLRRGGGEVIDFRPYQESPDERRLAGLSVADCDLAAALIETRPSPPVRVHRGAEAIGLALRRLPGLRSVGWRWLGRISSSRVTRPVALAAYRWVAGRRFLT